MNGEEIGKFLTACRTPTSAGNIIRRIFPCELSDLEPFYVLKRHCLERGLIAFERTPEGLSRYHLTVRGRESLQTFEKLFGDEPAENSLSLVNY